MEIITSLGVNSTLFYQLGLFILTFVILNKLVFTPYLHAHRERGHRATSNEDLARQLFVESQDLEVHYEKRARTINDQVKSIFDKARGDAYRRQAEILEKARAEAQDVVEKTRERIRQSSEAAHRDLEKDLPAITSAIVSKVAGKEINA